MLIIISHLFSKYLLNAYYRPGAENTVVNKTKKMDLPSWKLIVIVGDKVIDPGDHTNECRIKTTVNVK